MMGIDDSTINAVVLTLKLALITSVMLMLFVTPLAWGLSRWQSAFKPFVLAIFTLPLVLPPTVLGFYLLVAFSPQSPVGEVWVSITGEALAFSFEGLVLGSIIYSFPFALQPLYGGFMQLDSRYLDVSRSLGLNRLQTYVKVVLPLCKTPALVAFGLSFAHTIGEFGVVLLIGGNIPGETQVLSISLYEQVEALEYQQAHLLSIGLLLFSFTLLVLLYRFSGKGGLGWNLSSR